MLRLAAAVFFLTWALALGPWASVPAGQQAAATAPFTAGITDAASLRRAVDARAARARQLLDAMLAVKGPRTVANTLAPYDELVSDLFTASGHAQLMADLHPDAATREVADELNRTVSAFRDEIPLRPDVYEALKAIDLQGADAATRYYLTRELREFTRAGVDKPDATRARLRELRDQLTRLMDEFARNLRSGSRRVTGLTLADLDGLPADFVARFKATPSDITLTTSGVDARPVFLYARSSELRQKMLTAYYNIAAPENVAVIDRILRVRGEIAGLLGYRNWAAYDTDARMAGDEKTASAFIDRVVEAARPRADRELADLLRRKQQDRPGASLDAWDRLYYSELVRRSNYAFDSQTVRPYFAFDRVVSGVMNLTSTIFGITYRPVTNVPVWHPSVRVFEMHDGGQLVGRVYLDLHERRDKAANGAGTYTLRQGRKGSVIPEVVLAAALRSDEPQDPGLLTHDDVRTLFHEFGHVVHRLIGGHQPWHGLSSLALERDFTEAPSQMLEEWIWDPKALATFARHYQTGLPIPAALVQQMRRASEFGQGMEVAQQMVLARVALSYHDREPGSFDQNTLWKEIQARTLDVPFIDGTSRQASFPHLGQPGYASAYYTYMWSLVIGKDLFTRFEGRDLTQSRVARQYLETVFQPGSSRKAADLVEAFLGRPFSADAWERWLNAGAH